MKKIFILICTFFVKNVVCAQITETENYIHKRTYLESVTTTSTTAKQIESIQYFDGLGRSKQITNVKASPQGKDVVTHIEYDQFGRQIKNYLPVPQNGTLNGGIVSDPLGNASSVYGGEKIYSEKILENSPLDRIQQQIREGNDWSNKPVKYEYNTASVADEVRKFTVVTTWENGATKSVLGENWLYTDNQLYKNTIIDEDGNKKIEFKNRKGQLIMVRKDGGASTYYVYNEYDQLAWILPPIASMRGDIVSNIVKHDELCYQYRYDGRGRLVEKKLPGKGWEYVVYDKQDRLVATQDAELRKKGQWLYTKYDPLGRVAITGICTGGERLQEQGLANGYGLNNVNRINTAFFERQGMNVYYDNPDSTYPNSTKWVTLLSLNYYDTYPAYNFNPAFPDNTPEMTVLTGSPSSDGRSTKGLSLMNLVKNIEDDNWTKNYTYYDIKGRVVGTHSINHLGGYTRVLSDLDFSGMPKVTITKHKRITTDIEKVITETFDYDHQNRLLVHKHQIDNNPVEILTQNKYNELSQLETKKVGGINIAAPLQTIGYKYNIRGWLTQINDPDNLGTDLFGYKINYNKIEGLEIPNQDYPDLKVKAKYNGNIAEISWKTLTEENEPLKRYGYSYDNLNRLSAGFYQKTGQENFKEFFEIIDYDLNGNIQRLKRSDFALAGTNIARVIDNLKYDYTGNKLVKITDEQQNPSGYPYLANPNTLLYDDNGNMTSHPDKDISSIEYNYLNLPKQITRSSDITKYVYRADGTKIKKFFGNKLEVDYLNGFQYKSTFDFESWSGDGTYNPDPNEIPVVKLRIIPTDEGYFDALKGQYVYNFTDHLGNVRVSYSDTNKDGIIQPRSYIVTECKPKMGCMDNWKDGEILDINNYYPFGLIHNYNGTTQNAYQYKYNGKELQETGMYDYGARFYMPDLGRWGGIDPKSQYTHETYSYVWNNPIQFIDPTGMMAETFGIIAYPNRDGAFNGEIVKDSDGEFIWNGTNWIDTKDGSSLSTTVTLIGKAKSSDSGPGSLALSALMVSQFDSPAPGPADVVGAFMLLGAGVWWTVNQFTIPSTGYTTIADPGAGMRNLNSESDAEDTDVNGVKVPKEEKDFDDVWNDAKDGDPTKGKSTQKEKDISDWEQDSKIKLQNEKEINTKFGKGRTGLDSNGNRVNVRPGSKGANGGNPTIERIKNGRYQKIRYK
ncbi:DUF6443 domain-containing protein [Chryseobacterium arthrosphaerae]|uniref:DUF6443 domain-containing protein n=1 Tax=Chryseobacterium arthrosphaerae TaxID=651561 RepID=A0A1B8ZVI9_9FLAO|nr:DUF6443 domain-containing protein [Chryseobacterium arthrosphaerae]OCA75574.1 hypothetical protein BBI00_15105 [Chryseobacterium arthrosphaerae]